MPIDPAGFGYEPLMIELTGSYADRLNDLLAKSPAYFCL